MKVGVDKSEIETLILTNVDLTFKGQFTQQESSAEGYTLTIKTVEDNQSAYLLSQEVVIKEKSKPFQWAVESSISIYFKFAHYQYLEITFQNKQNIFRGKVSYGAILSRRLKANRFKLKNISNEKSEESVNIIIEWFLNDNSWLLKNISMRIKAIQIIKHSSKISSQTRPYLKFLRKIDGDMYVQVAKTQPLDQKSHQKEWKIIKIAFSDLVSNIIDTTFIIQCWHTQEGIDPQWSQQDDIFIGETAVVAKTLARKQNKQAQVFTIKAKNSQKIYGKISIIDKTFQDPFNILTCTKKLNLCVAFGINIKNPQNLQRKLEDTCNLIDKIWQLLSPYVNFHYKHFYALNIQPLSDQQDKEQSERQQRFANIINYDDQQQIIQPPTRASKGVAQQKLEKKNSNKIPNQMFFSQERCPQYYIQSESIINQIKQYFIKNFDRIQSDKESQLPQFIKQIEKIPSVSSINDTQYRVAVIITDSELDLLQQSILLMATHTYPISFFIINIGDQSLQDYDIIFNQQILKSLNGAYQTTRPLTRYDQFQHTSQLHEIEQFAIRTFKPLSHHIDAYIEMVQQRASKNKKEQNMKIEEQTQAARRSSHTRFSDTEII